MRETLLAAMANHNLMLADYYRQDAGGALQCKFAFHGGRLQWYRSDNQIWQDIEVEDFVRRIVRLPEDEWVDLHVFARIEQQEAINMGLKVVNPILNVLRALTPVYEEVISQR